LCLEISNECGNVVAVMTAEVEDMKLALEII
jgi:hypothetical protein